MPEGRGIGELSEKDKGLKRNKLVVERWSQGWGVQHRNIVSSNVMAMSRAR